MSEPVSFPTATSRFGLPLLFAGQAQKEFYFNEAISLADILLHPVVQGETETTPSSPMEGDCWIVGPQPAGAFADHAGYLAGYQSGQWLFAAPREGMRAFDVSMMAERRYDGGWTTPPVIAAPSGGSVVDVQARAVISSLLAALLGSGILRQA